MFRIGESPVWLAGEQRLAFIDIKARRLHRFDPATGARQVDTVDEDIGCIAPAVGGGFIAGLRSGIWMLDEGGGKRRKSGTVHHRPIWRKL